MMPLKIRWALFQNFTQVYSNRSTNSSLLKALQRLTATKNDTRPQMLKISQIDVQYNGRPKINIKAATTIRQ